MSKFTSVFIWERCSKLSWLIAFFFICSTCCDVLSFRLLQKNQKKSDHMQHNTFNSRQNLNSFSAEILEIAFLKLDKLVAKYGYPFEQHHVTTEDGYILGVHRIPKPSGEPIFLMHGLSDSSATFLNFGPQISLGYDIWMGNARGNKYSRNHTKKDPDSRSFWEFSFHEIGVYDLPAMIDYVLEHTGFKQLIYIGHSQGNAAVLILCSEKPEYNKKISLAHGLAPGVFMENVPGPLTQWGATNLRMFEQILISLRIYEIPEIYEISRFCRMSIATNDLCLTVVQLIAGPDEGRFNTSLSPILWENFPAGFSVYQLFHYGQVILSAKFQHYDYGAVKNQLKYRQRTPPEYDLKKVTVPYVLYCAMNDFLVAPENVNRLFKTLPNSKGLYRFDHYNHLDVIWASDAKDLVFSKIVKIINEFKIGGEDNITVIVE